MRARSIRRRRTSPYVLNAHGAHSLIVTLTWLCRAMLPARCRVAVIASYSRLDQSSVIAMCCASLAHATSSSTERSRSAVVRLCVFIDTATASCITAPTVVTAVSLFSATGRDAPNAFHPRSIRTSPPTSAPHLCARQRRWQTRSAGLATRRKLADVGAQLY
jgi:hypothetical protein